LIEKGFTKVASGGHKTQDKTLIDSPDGGSSLATPGKLKLLKMGGCSKAMVYKK